MASDPAALKPADDRLARFPAPVREAHARFLATGDSHALDLVVLGIVRRHQPERLRAATPASPPDSARLIADLGFDSLALAEIVFYIEDLYAISVSNQELAGIATVGDLRAFIRTKIPGARA